MMRARGATASAAALVALACLATASPSAGAAEGVPPRGAGAGSASVHAGPDLATGAAPAPVDRGADDAARTAAWRRSTHVPIPTPEGQLFSYVVNADATGPARTALAEEAIRAAGGAVHQSWPEIGVVIARSRSAAFRSRVVAAAADDAVISAAPTRSVPVRSVPVRSVPVRSGPVRSGPVPPERTRATATDETRQAAPAPDPLEDEQWDMAQIKAKRAHAVTDGSRSVLVGVLDTGIDRQHPDLKANVEPNGSVSCTDGGRPDTAAGAWQPTSSTHGTHVAGIIAAARNGTGIVGVAPGVRLASVKVVDDDGLIYPEYAICGFVWSGRHGFDVANSSYFVDPFVYWCNDRPEQSATLLALRRAISYADAQGVVNVASANNEAYDLAHKTSDSGSPNDGRPVQRTVNNGCKSLPAEGPGVVAVSSVDRRKRLSDFSNFGRGVIDLTAPGSDVLSTLWGGGYGSMSGTSMAAPHVAGVAALIRSAHPGWTPARVRAALASGADDLRCPASDDRCTGPAASNAFFGEGLVDALAAVR